MNMLEVHNLKVKVNNKVIINNANLELAAKKNYVMFGPNGSGKTTLINAIMGLPQYKIVSGKIYFMGKDITTKSVEERAKLGLALAFQHPPEISGITLSSMLKLCVSKGPKDEFSAEEEDLINAFNLGKFLDRDVNVGFSGGERKRAEILQILLLKPRLLLLDEPDSGVDVESLRLISEQVQRYIDNSGSTAVIVTHKGDVLDYINAEYACVLMKNSVYCFANPKCIYETIKKRGYEECIACQKRTTEGW
ncbi:MAG: ABC transporter ATP-binding protein [Candidatus Bathyarchaeota archaeon]|nr:ABC transporter ATP-binding protein [Candidatus Bathyarchaeum sp.]